MTKDDQNQPNVEWRDVPSFFMETTLGSARLGGIARIAGGEFLFDHTPGANLPKLRHTVNWIIPIAAIPSLIEELQRIVDVEARSPSTITDGGADI